MKPRIYIASLADYNAGRLIGEWIDATQTPGALQKDIDAMLAKSREPWAEEWAVHDVEGMPNPGEYPDLAQVSAVAQGIAEHGDAFRAYVELFGVDEISAEDFEGRYCGEFGSASDWAEDLLESTGELAKVPQYLQAYLDLEGFAEDRLTGGNVRRSGRFWFWT